MDLNYYHYYIMTDALCLNPLIATPKHWFSWDFSVLHKEQIITQLDLSVWREKGIFKIQGLEYKVSRAKLLSGNYKLESMGNVIATANKPSLLRKRFIIQFLDNEFELVSKSIFGRSFLLLQSNKVIGSIKSANFLNRKAVVNLPDDIPIHVKSFMLWLVIIMWKRESNSSSGGS